MDVAARRAAEANMNRRDRMNGGEGGGRLGRSRAPAFLQSDDDDMDFAMEGQGRLRRRRHYDEAPVDDEDLTDDVSLSTLPIRGLVLFETGAFLTHPVFPRQALPLEHLGDIKANSISDWIATGRVRLTILKEFKNFLMTHVDENGASVYGQRIKTLGEGNIFDH